MKKWPHFWGHPILYIAHLHKRTSPFCCVPEVATTWTTWRAWTGTSHPVKKTSILIGTVPAKEDNFSSLLLHLYFLPTRYTFVRRGTKFVSGYRYLGDDGTDRREVVHDGTHRSRTGLLPFWGRCPRGSPNPKRLA